ncbi:MAG: aminoglycoside phosphotransferase [Thiothrix sp.]|nr:MAG: aminoglycoside phosphotransferase [Thiothrix sp.]
MTQDVRLEQLTEWVNTLPAWQGAQLAPASADASFRRYFRVSKEGKTAIAMDAPPDKENCAPFVDITARLRAAAVAAPELYAKNLFDGFLLLEDFGDTPLLNELSPSNADPLYESAMDTLLRVQQTDIDGLPEYSSEFLRREVDLMPEWFLKTHLGLAAEEIPDKLIENTFTNLINAVLEQPVAFVHRDYHSRNLMLAPENKLGVIDFQDAVWGPVTYDLVSLLRDCYVVWPQQRVKRWALAYHKEAIAEGVLPPIDEVSFLRWFDLMGLQRHLKVLGIFARLNHRDGKSGYLKDLPLTLSYVLTVGSQHPETCRLVEWMRQARIPERIGTVDIPA